MAVLEHGQTLENVAQTVEEGVKLEHVNATPLHQWEVGSYASDLTQKVVFAILVIAQVICMK